MAMSYDLKTIRNCEKSSNVKNHWNIAYYRYFQFLPGIEYHLCLVVLEALILLDSLVNLGNTVMISFVYG